MESGFDPGYRILNVAVRERITVLGYNAFNIGYRLSGIRRSMVLALDIRDTRLLCRLVSKFVYLALIRPETTIALMVVSRSI